MKGATQGTVMSENVFVIGLDPLNRTKLEALPEAGRYGFHRLLDVGEVTVRRDYPFDAVLDKAEHTLRMFPGSVDAIAGYWDFPVTLMVPLLCGRLGLPSPTLEAVLKCEHKYWSRLEQQDVAPDNTPAFAKVDPFADDPLAEVDLAYPFWLKPVKSFASHLGFRIRHAEDLRQALPLIRAGIPQIAETFNRFLAHADLPPAVEAVDGHHCIAEEIISGRQCTLEGFVFAGRPEIYGVVDSVRHANRSSFARYQYPSRLPRHVQDRMTEIAKHVIAHVGLDSSAFNMEFFWDAACDRIALLEINPRISQSHGDLFHKVDGVPHHQVMVELALGRRPRRSPGAGPFRCAGKFFLRRFADATVSRVPSAQQIAEIEDRFPGTQIVLHVRQGMRLSELDPQEQDSYSYIYALVFIGARHERELLDTYDACVRSLEFEFTE